MRGLSALLDSSVVVRYLTGDPPDLADRAARIIDREEELRVPEIVLVETAYVLTSVYQIPRELVVDHLILFMQKRNIHPLNLDRGLVLQALSLCRPSGRVSFADALLWATACATEGRTVYSFDGRFPHDGITVLDGRPPTASLRHE
jgi:predicted nucleic acid-binding protein